jgi:hypothetical protein
MITVAMTPPICPQRLSLHAFQLGCCRLRLLPCVPACSTCATERVASTTCSSDLTNEHATVDCGFRCQKAIKPILIETTPTEAIQKTCRF